MHTRFTIFITLLFIRVFFSPIWYSYNVDQLQHPQKAFEQVRLHKRRSGYADDVTHQEGVVSMSSHEEEHRVFSLLRIIKNWLCIVDAITIIPSYRYTYYTSPLFIRHCVLRI